MESDCEKNSSVGLSPNTVLPLKQNCSVGNAKKKSTKPRLSSRKDELLVLKGEFREISFSRYRSVSCKNAPLRQISQKCSAEYRRGSIYQSSREVSRMREMGVSEERRKIEVSRGAENSLSIFDSLCKSGEENLKLRTSEAKPRVGSDKFFEICLDPNSRGKNSADTTSRVSLNSSLRSDQVLSPLSNGNELPERDSVKVSLSSICESDLSEKAASKTRFNPIRKMFDPFTKSKSLRNPLNSSEVKTCPKPLVHDSSEIVAPCESRVSSPVHLRGHLKLEKKNGLPFFEFSLQCPEDVIVAKTWKAKGASSWVYTFHSTENGKKFESEKDCTSSSSSMVGQMQVSCYLCSELKEGVFDNSMVTEFVLHDIVHARLSGSSQDNSSWAKESLCPSLEIAAIVMKTPFEKRESLKHKRGDEKAPKKLLNLSMADEPMGPNPGDIKTAPDKVKVVIPAGNHGLPSSESGTESPSSLLDRWRSGGGCDCGGWDMACPIKVLGNPKFRCSHNSQSLLENQMPMELFVQGIKDKTPALTMRVIEEGLYEVDFHAQLSSLQAFSVCVAILHGTETSSDIVIAAEEKKLPQRNSLKMLIEEEVKFLIEAVTAEKINLTKRVKEIPSSYVLNPPFSPIARV